MKLITSILFLSFTFILKAHNPVWVQLDKSIINGLVKIDKDSIHLIEKYFQSRKSDKDLTNLGFGWEIWSTSKSGGYISISSNFYYYKGSLISFEI